MLVVEKFCLCLMLHLLGIIRETVQLFCLNAKLLCKSHGFGLFKANVGFWQELCWLDDVFVGHYQSLGCSVNAVLTKITSLIVLLTRLFPCPMNDSYLLN